MEVELRWLDGVAFIAETESGHTLTIDGAAAFGGQNRGGRPMEILLAGTAACSAFDVVHILKKGKQPLASLSVKTRGKRAETEPKVFTEIHLHFIARGAGLSETAFARAVHLSVEKYCSALRMLAASCQIDYSYEIESTHEKNTPELEH